MRIIPGILALLLATSGLLQAQDVPKTQETQDTPDPCDSVLPASMEYPAWPCVVVDALSGDQLLVRIKKVGLRRVKLAGLAAPSIHEPLGVVARYHLARMAKGLRSFVVMPAAPNGPWPRELTATLEDFSQAQLAAGMGRLLEPELTLMGPYTACRCRSAAAQAQRSRIGIWALDTPVASGSRAGLFRLYGEGMEPLGF